MKNILVIDAGRTSGWAYFKEGKVEKVGEISFNGSFADLYDEFAIQIGDLENSPSCTYIDTVVFEELMVFGKFMSGERYQVEAIFKLWAEETVGQHEGIHPATVKKLLTGQGNCSKIDLRRFVKEKVEIPKGYKSNQHVVDAIAAGLAWYILNEKEFVL